MREERRAQGHRDAGGLPWWSFVVAERCLSGRYTEEVARLPKHHAAALRKALSWFDSEETRRSVASLGVVLTWMGLRNPQRPGRSTNIGGLPQQLLRLLTRRKNGQAYSLSSVAHRSHRTGAVGDAAAREAGFLETLAQAGLLRWWTPPPTVPEWMQGNGYPFAVYRITEPEAFELGSPPA